MGARRKKEYHKAAALASKLWINQNKGGIKVAITIVHLGEDPPEDLLTYVSQVENDNVKIIFVRAGDMQCAQKAQLSRMYLFEKDFVDDEDLIMTADADGFVIGDKLIRILEQPHIVWIAE